MCSTKVAQRSTVAGRVVARIGIGAFASAVAAGIVLHKVAIEERRSTELSLRTACEHSLTDECDNVMVGGGERGEEGKGGEAIESRYEGFISRSIVRLLWRAKELRQLHGNGLCFLCSQGAFASESGSERMFALRKKGMMKRRKKQYLEEEEEVDEGAGLGLCLRCAVRCWGLT